MSKIDYKKYPRLNEQVTYVKDLENLVTLLKKKIEILKEDDSIDPKTINDNAIAIVKAKLEIEGTERKIVEKKSTCRTMEGTLVDCLLEMESSYDGLIHKAKDSDSLDAKRIAERDLENEEDRVAQYLDLKQYFHNKEQGVVPLNAQK